jgi:hypothetical protein
VNMSGIEVTKTLGIIFRSLMVVSIVGWEIGFNSSIAWSSKSRSFPDALGAQSTSFSPSLISDLLNTKPEAATLSSNKSTDATDTMTEIISVSELSDVQPGDWAFQALQSLIEKYDCIAGDLNAAYRGEQALTRYEFAAELNRCLVQINEYITEETTNFATQEDLATLQRLTEEFKAELSAVQSQVSILENQTAELEANQFSTTTQLSGEVVFAATGIFGDEIATSEGKNELLNETVIFSNRVRLFFNTSFTGEDLLRVRLQSGNTSNLSEATGTSMARLGFDANSENQLELNQLYYRFRIGELAEVTVIASGTLFDVADTLNPLLGSDSKGSPFLFGVRSPIYRENIGGTGAGVSYDLSPNVNLSLVYLATEAGDISAGLFSGPFSALGQLTWRPNDDIDIGLVYSRSYNGIEINAGSGNANVPFGNASQSITANSYGLVANIRINPRVSLGGWAGFVQATATDLPDNPTADISYYAVTLAFPDLGGEGNLGGIVFGQPPKLIRNEFGRDDADTALNIEAFYRFQMNDHISITPGLLIITNPEHNRDNSTIYVGTIRTTFSF